MGIHRKKWSAPLKILGHPLNSGTPLNFNFSTPHPVFWAQISRPLLKIRGTCYHDLYVPFFFQDVYCSHPRCPFCSHLCPFRSHISIFVLTCTLFVPT